MYNKWYEILLQCSNFLVWFGLLLVFNTTFNNVSFILWRSVLMVEETGVAEENHQPVASH